MNVIEHIEELKQAIFEGRPLYIATSNIEVVVKELREDSPYVAGGCYISGIVFSRPDVDAFQLEFQRVQHFCEDIMWNEKGTPYLSETELRIRPEYLYTYPYGGSEMAKTLFKS